MHMVNDQAPQPDQGDGVSVIPDDRNHPAYSPGKTYKFYLSFGLPAMASGSSVIEKETVTDAINDALALLESVEGHFDARLLDENGEDVALYLDPIVYMLNFKLRRALMCRGESQVEAALGRGFKKVTQKHFVKYLDEARKGFRRKPKAKGSKRK